MQHLQVLKLKTDIIKAADYEINLLLVLYLKHISVHTVSLYFIRDLMPRIHITSYNNFHESRMANKGWIWWTDVAQSIEKCAYSFLHAQKIILKIYRHGEHGINSCTPQILRDVIIFVCPCTFFGTPFLIIAPRQVTALGGRWQLQLPYACVMMRVYSNPPPRSYSTHGCKLLTSTFQLSTRITSISSTEKTLPFPRQYIATYQKS